MPPTPQNRPTSAPRQGPEPKAFFRKTDLIWVGLALLAALVLLPFVLPKTPGAVAEVTVADSGEAATVLPLDTDGTFTIEGGQFPVYLQVENGAVRFVDSPCPDHVCEDFGWLSREGEWALCAPAGVTVRVVEQD